jgi:hypothetical protein
MKLYVITYQRMGATYYAEQEGVNIADAKLKFQLLNPDVNIGNIESL